MAACFYYSRQYQQSERQLHNLLELNPTFIRAYVLLGKVHEQKGEAVKAIAMLSRALELAPDDPVTMSVMAHALATAGDMVEARKILADLEAIGDRRYVSSLQMAAIRIGLGETDQALESLEQAYDNRDVELVWLKINPVFDPIRSDARFVDLVERVNPQLL